MADNYGPWATPINAGMNPQLSAFWKTRLTMLVSASHTSPDLSRRSLLMLAGTAVAISHVPTLRDRSARAEQPRNPEGAVEQVRAAWQKRRANVTSFRYECQEIGRRSVAKGVPNRPTGPFALEPDVDPTRNIAFRGSFTYSLAGEKIAFLEERESEQGQTTENRGSFDTVYYKLLSYGPLPMGELIPAAKPGKPENISSDGFRVNANQTALWLWFSPIVQLQRLGYRPDKMQVRRLHVSRDGHDCLEGSIPTDTPSSWEILLDVDPARDYLPLAYVQQKKGTVRRDISIQYVHDKEAGWRVSAWDDKWFNESGSLRGSSRYEVKRCAINTPIGDEVFTFEFPKGAHIAERDGDAVKFFIAMGDGTRQYISENEFGALPPPKKP